MSGVWEGLAQRLEGKLVVLEPLAPEHADGLRESAADPAIWRLMTVHGHQADVFDEWFESTLANAAERLASCLDAAVRAGSRFEAPLRGRVERSSGLVGQ